MGGRLSAHTDCMCLEFLAFRADRGLIGKLAILDFFDYGILGRIAVFVKVNDAGSALKVLSRLYGRTQLFAARGAGFFDSVE